MITFRTIILQSTIVDKVKQLTWLIAWEDQARDMWNTPLSPTWELPATHYISSWIISDEFALLLPCFWYLDNWEWGKIYAWKAETISQAIWVAIQNIESLFSLMDVSEQSSNEALLRLKLKLCENID